MPATLHIEQHFTASNSVRDIVIGMADGLTEALSQNPEAWVDFMMRFELGLDPIEPDRARNSALTIAGAYIAGGLIPLLPYMRLSTTGPALILSVGLTLIVLFAFGFFKGHFTSTQPFRSGLQTALIGGTAAAAAFLIARAIS